MRMLDEGTEVTDVEVLREDQNRINRFSSLNTQMDHLEDDEKESSTSKEYLDDLIMEMELMDEDEIVKFKIGDAFVDIPQSEAMERLEKQQQDVDAKLDKTQSRMSEIKEEMEELKKHLYEKFGNSISLER
ncbi:putative prefoldin subunit 4 [Yarrowia sp. C11]|nr:putative prefoldin subunit 4 [Yarrowia sp. C11]KAG5358792.1 putative prefoldin subunit 4 [Yarrowia sp. E02]